MKTKKKIKIAILIGEFKSLRNYQLRIIEKIISDKNLELSLLIKDGRVGKDNVYSFKNKFKRFINSKNLFGFPLFKLQLLIENYFFKIIPTVEKDSIIEKLKSIETIYLKPKRKGFFDIFDDIDSKKVKSYNLDIILRHEFNIIRGKILKSARYGIWSFHHGDNSIYRGSPPAFWEILNKEPVVGVTLQHLTPELDGGLVIDKAFYNLSWSCIRSQNALYEGCVTLLFKNIRLLQRGHLSYKKSSVYYNPLYKRPRILKVLKYMYNFYLTILLKLFHKLNYLVFAKRYNCWSLFIGEGNFIESTLFKLKPVKMPKNKFWADPFIFKYKDENYVFFENYDYKSKKGKISCGKIKGNQLINIIDVLNLNYHVSYPFIFKENDDIFLLPETNSNNRLELYKCIEFPIKWKLYSTLFEGEKVSDPHIFKDHKNQNWLFVNKFENINCPKDAELYIYKFDNLKFNNLQPHLYNPVLINSAKARNAGPIFEFNNEIFRPSQANIEGIYGRALNINKIEKLTLNEYVEKTVETTFPNYKKGLISMHHLDQKDDFFIIDSAYYKM